MLFIAKVGVVPVIDGAGSAGRASSPGKPRRDALQALWDSNGDGGQPATAEATAQTASRPRPRHPCPRRSPQQRLPGQQASKEV